MAKKVPAHRASPNDTARLYQDDARAILADIRWLRLHLVRAEWMAAHCHREVMNRVGRIVELFRGMQDGGDVRGH